MSLFNSRRPPAPTGQPGRNAIADNIPVAQVDLSKQYDIYCHFLHEDRIYEDVRILGIRTLDRISEYSHGVIGGYIEIETMDGARAMIPNYHVQILCEHGVQPAYRVIQRRGK